MFLPLLFTVYSVSVEPIETIDVEPREVTIVQEQQDGYSLDERLFVLRYEENVPNWNVDCKSENHTYMDYRTITSRSSKQWEIETEATTDADGLRIRNGRYLVAIGLGYGLCVGDDAIVVMEDGTQIPVTIGDVKAPTDCDATNRYQKFDGSVVEYIVDTDIFKGTESYPTKLLGKVEKIISTEALLK